MNTPTSKVEPTARYTAKGSDGKTYDVIQTTTFINVTTISDSQPQWQAAGHRLTLPNGDPINKTGPGEYVVVRTGITLRFPGP